MPPRKRKTETTASASKVPKLTQTKLSKTGGITVDKEEDKAIQESGKCDYNHLIIKCKSHIPSRFRYRFCDTSSLDTKVVLKDLLTGDEWKQVLKSELDSAYFKGIESFLNSEYSKGKQIFPPKDKIFNIFNIIAPDKVSLYFIV